jgi:tRNA A-37 threonylcarbamoyl transferase component Bud32
VHQIHKFKPISDQAALELCRYLDTPVDEATTVNSCKQQYIFETTADGIPTIAKVYHHRTLPHRLASALRSGNAERYARACTNLATHGVNVPEPILIAKRGSGLLPDRVLLAMTRLPGRMLLEELSAIEGDPDRIRRLVPNLHRLFDSLRQARIVHRDLSSKNILISDTDDLMLIDFDSSRTYRGTNSSFERKHLRDIENFTSTCSLAPRLAQAMREALDHNRSQR